MKYGRNQTVGKIRFIVESHFKSSDAAKPKDLLAAIMVNRAKEALQNMNKTISTVQQNDTRTIYKI